jgi:hypothetical protein
VFKSTVVLDLLSVSTRTLRRIPLTSIPASALLPELANYWRHRPCRKEEPNQLWPTRASLIFMAYLRGSTSKLVTTSGSVFVWSIGMRVWETSTNQGGRDLPRCLVRQNSISRDLPEVTKRGENTTYIFVFLSLVNLLASIK